MKQAAKDGQAEVIDGALPMETLTGFLAGFMPEHPRGEDAVEESLDERGLEEACAFLSLEADAEGIAPCSAPPIRPNNRSIIVNHRSTAHSAFNNCKQALSAPIMPFDPNLPQENTLIDAVQMRGQLNGLKSLIDAIQSISAAQADGTNTLPPGSAANVNLSVISDTLRFTFGIPRGNDGTAGTQGPPGEVTNAQLSNAISGTSNNSNAVATLGLVVSDPPTQAKMQALVNKVDELITALRR